MEGCTLLAGICIHLQECGGAQLWSSPSLSPPNSRINDATWQSSLCLGHARRCLAQGHLMAHAWSKLWIEVSPVKVQLSIAQLSTDPWLSTGCYVVLCCFFGLTQLTRLWALHEAGGGLGWCAPSKFITTSVPLSLSLYGAEWQCKQGEPVTVL